MRRGDHVQRLPHQLDQAVLGHETGGKHVTEGAPGRPCRRMGHVFGEHLLRGVDQDEGVLGQEADVHIEPGELVLELSDRLAAQVAPGDAQRMQERQFERPILGKQGGGVLAVRDGGEEFEQQGLGVFHCDGLSESGVRCVPGLIRLASHGQHVIYATFLAMRGQRMRRIGFIVCPGFQLIGYTAFSVFEIANLLSEPPAYELSVLSEAGGLVRGSAAVSVETRRLDDVSGYDTLIGCVSLDLQQTSPEMLDLLRAAAPATRRIGAISTGAFLLAEAGLLRGRRATTPWTAARELARRFPDTLVDEDRIFVADQGIWTSAGMTAGLGLTLAMVEEGLGRELARSVARAMVLYPRRSGGQSRPSARLDLEPTSGRIQSA